MTTYIHEFKIINISIFLQIKNNLVIVGYDSTLNNENIEYNYSIQKNEIRQIFNRNNHFDCCIFIHDLQ